MKPAPFDYYRPKTVSEACGLLSEMQGDGRVLAGGQTLIPTLAMRIASPDALIDISRVEGFDVIRQERDELVVAAMVRQSDLEQALFQDFRQPVLSAILPWVAHPPIRHRGTVCGSLAHADPSAEIPLALVTLGGRLLVRGSKKERYISASEFFLGTLQTSLDPDELILQAHFPLLGPEARIGFSEFGYRSGDFAVTSVLVIRDATGVRLGFGGIDDFPRTFEFPGLSEAGELRAIVRKLSSELEVRSDPTAPAAFRRHLMLVLSNQAICQAWEEN